MLTRSERYGDDTPKILKEFLKRTNHVGMVKVVFGPHESFFAWSEDTVRWSDIPRGMEKTVQSWITSHGWRYGAPNIVTLGCKHSYFIASAQGAADYRVPHFLRQTTQSMVRWETDGCKKLMVC